MNKEVAARIKDLRENILHLTQAEFGREIGIARQRVWHLENGTYLPTLAVCKALHDKFEINLNWLIGGDTLVRPHESPDPNEPTGLAS